MSPRQAGAEKTGFTLWLPDTSLKDLGDVMVELGHG